MAAQHGWAAAYGLPSSGFLNSTNNGVFYEADCNLAMMNTGFYINGTLQTTAGCVYTNGATYESTAQVYLGKAPSGDTADTSTKISELIFFNYSLLPMQQNAIRTSIMNRYASAVPTPP